VASRTTKAGKKRDEFQLGMLGEAKGNEEA
jgi:hypothetical protein